MPNTRARQAREHKTTQSTQTGQARKYLSRQARQARDLANSRKRGSLDIYIRTFFTVYIIEKP